MNKLLYPFIALVAGAVLAGCGKKETASEEAAAPETAHEENVVTLTKQNLEHVEIKTESVKPGSLETTLKAAGRVSENMNKTAKVASTLEGRLIKLNFDINDRVKVGDVLALVQTPELLGKPLELKAPIDGVIIERKSAVGELVDKGSAIYTISDPADLWVIAEVKERDIAAVKVGQDAVFKVLAYAGEEFHGKVVRLGNQVEADSRTLEVRIETRQRRRTLEGRHVRRRGNHDHDHERRAASFPTPRCKAMGTTKSCLSRLATTNSKSVSSQLGMEQRGRVQVLDGVKAGEQIVTEGSFILKSELLKGELGEE